MREELPGRSEKKKIFGEMSSRQKSRQEDQRQSKFRERGGRRE